MAVMDDFMAHIDWRAILCERELDDLDGTIDPGAEAARRGEIDSQREAQPCRPELLAHASHVRPGIYVKRLKRRPVGPCRACGLGIV